MISFVPFRDPMIPVAARDCVCLRGDPTPKGMVSGPARLTAKALRLHCAAGSWTEKTSFHRVGTVVPTRNAKKIDGQEIKGDNSADGTRAQNGSMACSSCDSGRLA
jgi:hypothetical protein